MPIFTVTEKEMQPPKNTNLYTGWLLLLSIAVQTVTVLFWLSRVEYDLFIIVMILFSIFCTTIAFFEHVMSLSLPLSRVLLSLSGYLATIVIDCVIFSFIVADLNVILLNRPLFNFMIVASCITLISNLTYRQIGKREFLTWMFFLGLGIATDLLIFVGFRVSATLYPGVATPEEIQLYTTLSWLVDVIIFVLIYLFIIAIQGKHNMKQVFILNDTRQTIFNYLIPLLAWGASILTFSIYKLVTGSGSLGYYVFIAFLSFTLIFDWIIYNKKTFVLFMLLSQIILLFSILEIFKVI